MNLNRSILGSDIDSDTISPVNCNQFSFCAMCQCRCRYTYYEQAVLFHDKKLIGICKVGMRNTENFPATESIFYEYFDSKKGELGFDGNDSSDGKLHYSLSLGKVSPRHEISFTYARPSTRSIRIKSSRDVRSHIAYASGTHCEYFQKETIVGSHFRCESNYFTNRSSQANANDTWQMFWR